MPTNKRPTPPILSNKRPRSTSVFSPAALLREARRQKGLVEVAVPPVCILDPDGDIVRSLRQAGAAQPFAAWPCYHTRLDTFALAGETVGIVGCAVGAPFAVLATDAPFRETAGAIRAARRQGVLAVEMEAAALYTFARARSARILCLAHVTNTMGQSERDFEKGADGTAEALAVLATIVGAIAAG